MEKLCSTGNYIQYPVINHDKKEYEKNVRVYIYIYICTTESLGCIAEISIVNQLYVNKVNLKKVFGDSVSGPVVKTPHFHCRGA